MNDDRIHRYLSAQADAIPLTPADPAGVVRRGNRRRTQRRVGLLGAVAVLGITATSVAVYDSGGPGTADVAGVNIVASPFEWDVVAPESGLGYSRASVTLSDGSLYGLSTAPGPVQGEASFGTHLYRSGDGTEWSEVALPPDVSASSLAAQGGTLYAIGTSPAGGGTRDLVVAASSDGAQTWSNITLPSEIAELEARFPDEVMIGSISMAAQDDTHLVAAVSVQASIDPHKLIDDLPEDASWEMSPGGLRVYAAPSGEECDALADGEVRCAAELEQRFRADPTGMPNGPLIGEYSWSELGVHPDLQALISGRTYVYASEDGQTFTRTSLPGDPRGWSGSPVATADGYRMFVSTSSLQSMSTAVFTSADGLTWMSAGELPGSVKSAGLLGDRAAVALDTMSGSTLVQVEEPDGTWVPVDLREALGDIEADSVWIGHVAFGPLGLAADATVLGADDEGQGGAFVIHSQDGRNLSVLPVGDELPSYGSVAGLDVTADAIVVRVQDPGDLNPNTPPTQTLLVGTPR